MKTHSILGAFAIIVGAGALGVTGVSSADHSQTPTAPAAPAVAPLEDLRLPAGFTISVFYRVTYGGR